MGTSVKGKLDMEMLGIGTPGKGTLGMGTYVKRTLGMEMLGMGTPGKGTLAMGTHGKGTLSMGTPVIVSCCCGDTWRGGTWGGDTWRGAVGRGPWPPSRDGVSLGVSLGLSPRCPRAGSGPRGPT